MRYAIFLNLFFALAACGGSGSSGAGETGGADGTGGSGTSDTFSPISLNSTITKVQPMTGLVFWTGNTTALNTLADNVQLEFSYMVYSDIVEESGVYKWDVVDDLLDEVAARRHQALLRFRYAYPGYIGVTVPAYIASSAGYNSTIV